MNLRYLTLALSTLLSLSLQAQTVRYLEKKGIETETASVMSAVTTSMSDDKRKLGINLFRQEMGPTGASPKIKVNTSAILMNLATGKVELNQRNMGLNFKGSNVYVTDFSKSGDRWIQAVDFRKSLSTWSYDSAKNQRVNVKTPNLTEGYVVDYFSGIFSGTENYVFATLPDDPRESALLELQGNEYKVKYKLSLISPRVSKDSTLVYGISIGTGKDIGRMKIAIHDFKTGRTMRDITMDGSPVYVHMMSNGNLAYATQDITFNKTTGQIEAVKHNIRVADATGKKVLSEFRDTGLSFEMSDDEKQILTASQNGTIKLLDVETGQTLASVVDTYIKSDSRGPLFGNASKSVSMIVNKLLGGDYYLVGYSTGIMSLFSRKDRKVVANIYVDLADWAVIGADGRVDGSAGAFEKLEWRDYNGDQLVGKASIESMFDRDYTPRLLYSIMSGEAVAPSTPKISSAAVVPVLQFETINNQKPSLASGETLIYTANDKTLNVTIAVSNNPQVTEIRLYQNGKLVSFQPANEQGKYSFKVSLNSVFGNSNALYAIASTKQGVDSEKLKAVINYTETAAPKARLFVFTVGINKYLNPRYQLNYALSDATAIKSQMSGNSSSLFESIVVRSLFDSEATKERISQVFDEFGKTAREEDMFLFYFAGHGTMSDNPRSPEFYIVPHDVTQLYGNDQILKDKAMSGEEIRKLSMGLAAQKQIFIIDACHSAAALGPASTRGATEEKAIAQLARSTGTFWLTSAGSDQLAAEFEKLGHGVFTFSLLEALQGKDAASAMDGTITIREISSYVEQRVPELSQQFKGAPQYPASFSFGNDFPLIIQSPR